MWRAWGWILNSGTGPARKLLCSPRGKKGGCDQDGIGRDGAKQRFKSILETDALSTFSFYPVSYGIYLIVLWDFPGGSDGKASAYNVGDPSSVPGSGISPGEGNGSPL